VGIINKVKDMFTTKQQDNYESYIKEVLQSKRLPQRGDKEILRLYSHSPWLRAVTNRIAFKTASVNWKLYINRNADGEPVQNAKLKRANFDRRQKIINNDEDLEEIVDHPFLDALDDMNDMMIGLQGRQITQTYIDLVGKVYWLKERNSMGMPTNLYPLNPEWVERNENSSGYRVSLPGGWTGRVEEEDLILFNDPDPVNPYSEGTGIGNSLDDEVATDEMSSRYTKNFFYNSARPDILIYGDMGREDAERLKTDWKNKLQGFKNSYEPHFMPSGDRLNVQELSQTFDDMELVDLRKFERDTIIQVFGVPPEVLGIIENSNRATSREADTIMAKYVVVPRLELQRAILQKRLIPDYDERLVLDYDNPIPEDKEYKRDIMSNHEWAFSKNEIRQAANEEPTDDGDVYNVPINSVITDNPNENIPDEDKSVKKNINKIDENLVDKILSVIGDMQVKDETQAIYDSIIASVGQDALDQVDSMLDFNISTPYVDDYLQGKIGRRISYINETTKSELAETLTEGINQGESIPNLATRVSEVFDRAKNVRAETIARTETMSTVNGGTHAGYKQSNVVTSEEWIATPDSRVRPHHSTMGGQIVKVDAMFTSGLGNKAEYPGSFGIPKEDINCRCTIAPIVKGEESRYADEEKRYKYWKTMDAKAGGYERAMMSAYKRAFQTQQNAVMDILKEASN